MKINLKVPSLTLILLAGMLIFVLPAMAAVPVAKVTSFKGEVVIQSGIDIVNVSQVGQALKNGDRVLTKQGEAEITFADGALLKMRPFTVNMIQEREEEGGFLFFKTKDLVRRVTCFIGKFSFKSGASKRKNFVQSPTAVCGLRGTLVDEAVAESGRMTERVREGATERQGDVAAGNPAAVVIRNPYANPVFSSTATAANLNTTAQTPTQKARVKLVAANATKEVGVSLQNNPSPVVKQDAQNITTIQAPAQQQVAQAVVATAVIQEKVETTTNTEQKEQLTQVLQVLTSKTEEASAALEQTDTAVAEGKTQEATSSAAQVNTATATVTSTATSAEPTVTNVINTETASVQQTIRETVTEAPEVPTTEPTVVDEGPVVEEAPEEVEAPAEEAAPDTDPVIDPDDYDEAVVSPSGTGTQ